MLCLDVTSVSKNFSMSIMQQVSSALPYILLVLGVKAELISFWSTLDNLIQRLFATSQTLENVREIRKEFQLLIVSSSLHLFSISSDGLTVFCFVLLLFVLLLFVFFYRPKPRSFCQRSSQRVPKTCIICSNIFSWILKFG